mmetsp:Transcript_11075/g.22637  ORF Transcript_11075/g.22637 Transcript_11075/m.22637 type:complete len:83 (-) Transcript_11075:1333-1581(-)
MRSLIPVLTFPSCLSTLTLLTYYFMKAVTMAFSVGQRHDDDIAINDDDDVDNMDARQVAGWSATSAMASPAPKMEVVSNQGR